MSEMQPVILTATYIDSDDDTETMLGELECGENGVLGVVAAAPGQEEFLDQFTGELNAMETLSVKGLPPPGAPMFQIYATVYERSAPDFIEGLKRYAQNFYAVELVSADDLANEEAEYEDLT